MTVNKLNTIAQWLPVKVPAQLFLFLNSQLPTMALAWICVSTVGWYSKITLKMATSKILYTFTLTLHTMVNCSYLHTHTTTSHTLWQFYGVNIQIVSHRWTTTNCKCISFKHTKNKIHRWTLTQLFQWNIVQEEMNREQSQLPSTEEHVCSGTTMTLGGTTLKQLKTGLKWTQAVRNTRTHTQAWRQTKLVTHTRMHANTRTRAHTHKRRDDYPIYCTCCKFKPQ